MEKKYKRALVGYDQNSVEMFIKEQNKKNYDMLLQKNKIMADLKKENQALEDQKNELMLKLSEYQKVKTNLETFLFQVFINRTELLYKSEQQAKNVLAVQNKILNEYKMKNADLKKKVKDFIERIETEDTD